MQHKPVLGSEEADIILSAALAHARSKGWKVSIAVVDDGGHLLALKRENGASAATASIATGKARTAAVGQRESKFYEDMVGQGRLAFLTAPGLDCLLEGGIPVLMEGACVGAVGVSGVRSFEDAEVARAGIEKLAR